MLLCQEHHRLIDQQSHRFTVERLRQMKADHEVRIRQVTGGLSAAQMDPPADIDWITETLYSTLLLVQEMPRYVYSVPCRFNDSQIKDAAKLIIAPHAENEICPFVLHGGELICFHDLRLQDGPFRNLIADQKAPVKQYESRAWWGDPNREKWFVELLNRCLNKLTGRKRLNWDREHKRYYFEPANAGTPLEITYRPMNQSATSRHVVWQPITKKTGLPKPYWLHLAVGLQFHRVTKQDWCLSIRPELRVTRDGKTPIESKKIGSRVTRKKARMFNYDVLKEVHFWRDFLSGSQPRIILGFGSGQHLVVSTTMMQTDIRWPGIPARFAKPFTNVEYEEDLFTLAALEAIEENFASKGQDDWDDGDVSEETELFE
jgi:hypothetical protein